MSTSFQLLVDDSINASRSSQDSTDQLNSYGGTFEFGSGWEDLKRNDEARNGTIPGWGDGSVRLKNGTNATDDSLYFTFSGTSLDLIATWTCPSDTNCSFMFEIATEGQSHNVTGTNKVSNSSTSSLLSSSQLDDAQHVVHLSNFTGFQTSSDTVTTTGVDNLLLHYAVTTPGQQSRFPNGTVYVGLDSQYLRKSGTWRGDDGLGKDVDQRGGQASHEASDTVSMVYYGRPSMISLIGSIANTSHTLATGNNLTFPVSLDTVEAGGGNAGVVTFFSTNVVSPSPLFTIGSSSDGDAHSTHVATMGFKGGDAHTSSREFEGQVPSDVFGFRAFAYDVAGSGFSSLQDMPNFGWHDVDGNDSSKKGKIAGGVVGGVVGLGLIGGLVWWFLRRRRRRSRARY